MKKNNKKIALYILIAIPVLIFNAGCSSSLLLSDADAAKLVEDYYLFFFGGEKVNAQPIERGSFIKKYKCYPIKFKIFLSNSKHNERTLYFYKNEQGKFAVRGFMG